MKISPAHCNFDNPAGMGLPPAVEHLVVSGAPRTISGHEELEGIVHEATLAPTGKAPTGVGARSDRGDVPAGESERGGGLDLVAGFLEEADDPLGWLSALKDDHSNLGILVVETSPALIVVLQKLDESQFPKQVSEIRQNREELRQNLLTVKGTSLAEWLTEVRESLAA